MRQISHVFVVDVIGKTSISLQVHVKEHIYNQIQGLLEKSKIRPTCTWQKPQNMSEKREGLAD
jgi:hypothetical protein